MQIVLERDSIDKSLTFTICLLQLIFHIYILVCSPNTYAGVFNPNIPIFVSNFAEGLHFSAFHYKIYSFIFFFQVFLLLLAALMAGVSRYYYYRILFIPKHQITINYLIN